MPKHLSKLIVAAPALLLAACAGTPNRGIEPVHQPVVSHENFSFDLNTADGRLAPGEAERLQGWLASLRLSYGDHVAVDDPSGANGGARADIAQVIGDYGLLLDDKAPIAPGELASGAVRVTVTRSVAKVPGCPDFSKNGTTDFEANTASNFGCAVNSNLAAMVASPDDLVRGQPGAMASDPAVAGKAIQTLRKAPNTGAGGLKNEGTSK